MIILSMRKRKGRMSVVKRKSQRQQQTNSQDDVIVSFNGKEHRLEEWSKKELAAADEDHSLNWRKTFAEQTPSRPDEHKESAPALVKPKRKKRRKITNRHTTQRPFSEGVLINFFKSFWVPFITAIIVGLGIGFTVLILFSDKSQAPNQETATEVVADHKGTNGTSAANVNQGGQLDLSIQVIQEGLFSSQSAAQKEMDDIKDEYNVPAAAIKQNDQYSVLIGLTNDEAIRDTLKNDFTERSMDVFGKKWDFKAGDIQASKAVYEYLTTGNALFHELLADSSAIIANNSLDKTKLDKLEESLNEWNVPNDSSLSTSTKEEIKTFNNILKTAFSQIQDGESGQQPLLDALSLYQMICTSLK